MAVKNRNAVDRASAVELISNAHPKEIVTGDRVKCGPNLWVTVKHVWRTGIGAHDTTWIKWDDAWYPCQIDHGQRVLIERSRRAGAMGDSMPVRDGIVGAGASESAGPSPEGVSDAAAEPKVVDLMAALEASVAAAKAARLG